jgi:hypothetical protein
MDSRVHEDLGHQRSAAAMHPGYDDCWHVSSANTPRPCVPGSSIAPLGTADRAPRAGEQLVAPGRERPEMAVAPRFAVTRGVPVVRPSRSSRPDALRRRIPAKAWGGHAGFLHRRNDGLIGHSASGRSAIRVTLVDARRRSKGFQKTTVVIVLAATRFETGRGRRRVQAVRAAHSLSSTLPLPRRPGSGEAIARSRWLRRRCSGRFCPCSCRYFLHACRLQLPSCAKRKSRSTDRQQVSNNHVVAEPSE